MPLLLGGSKCSAWATNMGQRGCAVPCLADRAGDQDPAEVSCSAVEQPSTLWHSSEALSFPHCLISSGSSEPHLLVKQVQHLAISNHCFWEGGKSAQICLNCCCHYLTQIIFLTEVGLTHPQHTLWLASSPLSALQPRHEHAGFLLLQWDGAFTLLSCLYMSKKMDMWQGHQSHPFQPSLNLRKGFKGGLHLLLPVGFVTLLVLQLSGCQHLSPGWLGLCYFVLKLVCFFNGYK